MIDQVSMEKLRKKGPVDISRENRWIKLRAGRKERILKRKNNISQKLTEDIALSLVTKKVDVPSISTSSEISMLHIDNGSISIADWICFKRIIWG